MVLFQALLFVLIQNVELKNNFSELGYHPVPSCPTSEKERNDSTVRLNCSDTHKYHCIPYKTSQLYELCYKSFTVKKGHCLGITDYGNLNEDVCDKFVSGCPSNEYNSTDIYKYPKCLSIQGGCFTEDRLCYCLKEIERNLTVTPQNDRSMPKVTTTKPNGTSGQKPESASCENQKGYLIGFVICLILLTLSVAGNVVQFCISSRKQSRQENDKYKCTEEKLPLEPNAKENDRSPVSDRQQSRFEPDDIFRMTLVDYTFEDEQLFNLLKRQCLHGVPSEFEYLVNTRVTPNKKEYIFKQCDENGCILLHYAAQGGNTIILDEILRITSHKILNKKCIRGQSALHFAIKHQQTDMIEHLIKLHSEKRNRDKKKTPIHKETEADCDIVRGEFSPVHLAAWFGNTRLLTRLMENGFDFLAKTRNGLNILDIACMQNLCEESIVQYNFCEYLLSNEGLNIDPSKTDMSGWNIAHYASLSNFKLFEYLADIGKQYDLIKKPTKASKTCLHIACEFEKILIVKFITKHKELQTLISDKDALGWNALHFAAKGGNLDILEYLLNLKIEGMDIGCKTKDGKTLLHIACIHKKTEVCQFVLTQFGKNKNKYKELLNAKTTNNGLTAAHYLAVEKKEDGSEKNILAMFINTKKMDFSAKTNRGLTVLEFAIDHLNKELIKCIVSATYRKEFKINTAILDKCIKDTKEDSIKRILEATKDEMKLLSDQGAI